MQSWGLRSAWSSRDTAAFPTKSGIVGLLACSLGARSDETILRIAQAIRVGIRADKPGALAQDYATWGGAYPAHTMGNGRLKKTAAGYHTEQVFKDYLADASFLAAIQAAEVELFSDLVAAVKFPKWPQYLGRKAYFPAVPIFAGEQDFPDLEAALTGFAWPPDGLGRVAQVECDPTAPGAIRLRDQVLSARHRQFAPRYTREIVLVPQEV